MWCVPAMEYYSSLKKERNSETSKNMDEPQRQAKWSEPNVKGQTLCTSFM